MNQIKHFLSRAVILSLLLALLPFSVAGANGVTVSIDSPDSVDAGNNFVVRVNTTEVTSLDSFQFDVTYDPTVIDVSDITAGLIDSTTIPTQWNVRSQRGTIKVIGNLPGLSGVTGSGYLAEIHFYAIGSDDSTSDITLSEGKLFNNIPTEIPVTEWLGDSIQVSGTVTQPIIAFSPSSLSFSATEGEDNPPDQTLKIWNAGADTLSWEVSEDAAWLSLSPTSDSSTGEKDEVTASVDVTGMTADDYDATVTITAPGAGNTPRTVSLELHISTSGEPPEPPPDTPAKFSASNLQISPEQVQPNQQVEISITITNTGGKTGSHTASLYLNDEVEDSRTVSISPGSSESVAFQVTKPELGTYNVTLEGQEGQFTVTVSPPPSPSGLSTTAIIIIAIIVVLIVAIALVLVRARRRQA